MNKLNYVSTTDFKADNPQVDVSRYSDTTLSGIVTRASDKVDEFLGYSLLKEHLPNEKHEGMVDSDGNLTVFTNKRPIVTVSGCTITKGSDSITLTLTDGADKKYDILDSREFIYPDAELSVSSVSIIGTFWDIKHTRFFVYLSYQAGYDQADIPVWAKDSTYLYTRDILAREANIPGATSVKQGQVSITYERGEESSLKRQAEKVLALHRRRAF